MQLLRFGSLANNAFAIYLCYNVCVTWGTYLPTHQHFDISMSTSPLASGHNKGNMTKCKDIHKIKLTNEPLPPTSHVAKVSSTSRYWMRYKFALSTASNVIVAL